MSLAWIVVSEGARTMGLLSKIEAKHVLHAFLVGAAAGVIAYVLDTYVVARAETAIGITPGVL